MNSLHQLLHKKVTWYRNWHSHKLHKDFHWIVFLAVILIAGLSVLGEVHIYENELSFEPTHIEAATVSHTFFNKWSISSYKLRAYSLRDPSQYDLLAKPSNATKNWVYDSDVDAARAIHNPVLPTQLRIVLAAAERPTTGTLTTIWTTLLPNEWRTEADGSRPFNKMIQGWSSSGQDHYLELRFNPLPKVGGEFPGIGGGLKAYTGITAPGTWIGSGSYDGTSDSAQPQIGQMRVMYGVWTTFIQHVEKAGLVVSGVSYDYYSLWTFDKDRGFVHIFDRLPVETRSLDAFWYEYSGGGRPSGSATKYHFERDFLILRNAPISEVLADVATEGGAPYPTPYAYPTPSYPTPTYTTPPYTTPGTYTYETPYTTPAYTTPAPGYTYETPYTTPPAGYTYPTPEYYDYQTPYIPPVGGTVPPETPSYTYPTPSVTTSVPPTTPPLTTIVKRSTPPSSSSGTSRPFSLIERLSTFLSSYVSDATTQPPSSSVPNLTVDKEHQNSLIQSIASSTERDTLKQPWKFFLKVRDFVRYVVGSVY